MFERGERVDLWTPDDDRRLMALRARQKTYRYISAELGRSQSAVYARHLKLTGRIGARSKINPVSLVRHQNQPTKTVPIDALRDREQRLNAERDLTQTFFGDPPFSQSALAKKLGQS